MTPSNADILDRRGKYARPDAPTIEYVKGGFYEGRKKFRYRINGKPSVSVTEILDWTFGDGKMGAGRWSGQVVAVESLSGLAQDESVDIPWEDPKAVVKLLTERKLTVNHHTQSAGDRGSAVHAAAEEYAKTGTIPNPADFPLEQKGYIRALNRFLAESRPEFLATEVVVGSAKHRYAGTYDARALIGTQVGIIDYKTSKRIYDSHLFQVVAYEVAAVECGAEPSDFQATLHLQSDGDYDLEISTVTPREWIAQVEAFYAQQAAKARRAGK
jgi:hypothetical protein